MLSACRKSMQINLQHVFKMLLPECAHALSHTRHWSMDASMTSCSVLLQTFGRRCRSSSTFRI